MNTKITELDNLFKKVMIQIADAASKQDLAAVQSLSRKAVELKELSGQLGAIDSRFAILSGQNIEVPESVAVDPKCDVIRAFRIEVTAGMIRQNLLTLSRYVRSGRIKIGEQLVVEVLPSGRSFQTVLLEKGNKLRERGEIGQFYRDAKVKPGDYVLLTEVIPGRWALKIASPREGLS